MSKKLKVFMIAVVIMVMNVVKISFGWLKPISINAKSSKGAKNKNGSSKSQYHYQLIERFWTRNSRYSNRLFMVTVFHVAPPDFILHRSDPIPESKRNQGWKTIFVNTHLFMMASVSTHPRVYINWPGGGPQKSEGLDRDLAQSIHDGMAASSYFTGITGIAALLTAYQTAIDDWSELIAKIPIGTKQDKDNLALFSDNFRTVTSARLVEVVQGVVDSQKLNAKAIADSAAMSLRGVGKKSANEWSVKRVGEGTVELTAKIKEYKRKHYAVNWQMTTDTTQPETWYSMLFAIPPTPNGTTIVTGLIKGKEYFFRYRITLTDGTVSEWSSILSLTMS